MNKVLKIQTKIDLYNFETSYSYNTKTTRWNMATTISGSKGLLSTKIHKVESLIPDRKLMIEKHFKTLSTFFV